MIDKKFFNFSSPKHIETLCHKIENSIINQLCLKSLLRKYFISKVSEFFRLDLKFSTYKHNKIVSAEIKNNEIIAIYNKNNTTPLIILAEYARVSNNNYYIDEVIASNLIKRENEIFNKLLMKFIKINLVNKPLICCMNDDINLVNDGLFLTDDGLFITNKINNFKIDPKFKLFNNTIPIGDGYLCYIKNKGRIYIKKDCQVVLDFSNYTLDIFCDESICVILFDMKFIMFRDVNFYQKYTISKFKLINSINKNYEINHNLPEIQIFRRSSKDNFQQDIICPSFVLCTGRGKYLG